MMTSSSMQTSSCVLVTIVTGATEMPTLCPSKPVSVLFSLPCQVGNADPFFHPYMYETGRSYSLYMRREVKLVLYSFQYATCMRLGVKLVLYSFQYATGQALVDSETVSIKLSFFLDTEAKIYTIVLSTSKCHKVSDTREVVA